MEFGGKIMNPLLSPLKGGNNIPNPLLVPHTLGDFFNLDLHPL
jgi:hypothetical protein